jgi:hypothetical protein
VSHTNKIDLYVDGILVVSLGNLDNNQIFLDQARFGGMLSSSGSGASGIYYLDNFGIQAPLYLRPSSP